MLDDRDHYEAYYADKLWNLIPAIYRAQDTDQFDNAGPLRELVNRIGAQAATLRRSIDRLWEDQSIETCDDWVIPYIADLLATNLVNSLDARGQRIDVAKTIYYRRRKGTLAVLEEIAANITGWDARVVEFFRRMSRTRHSLDPAIEVPAEASNMSAQALATGDGATTVFNFILATPASTPVAPGTIAVFVAGIQIGADDNSGVITGAGLAGTVDYTTGAAVLTFVSPPASGTAIAIFYEYPVDGDRSVQLAEGLVGAITGTAIGGWADLRSVYGATLVDPELSATVRLAGYPHFAFDEFFHTADFRRGVGQIGWYNIPRLGVFLWRLASFGVDQTTPVAFTQCPGQFTFDPTGREVPLFAFSSRSYGNSWTSPAEWQLPAPITRPLLAPALGQNPAYPLYSTTDPLQGLVISNALGVFQNNGGVYDLIPASELTASPSIPTTAAFYIDPPRGRLVTRKSTSTDLRVTYHYGFPSTIGAGPYDRRAHGYTPASTPSPLKGGGTNLMAPLASLAPSGTVTIGDFLTYTATSDVGSVANGIVNVTVGAENKKRPLIRLPLAISGVTPWIFTGGDATHPGLLVLDGLFVSAGDIVLQGNFDTVSLICCTLDPGNAGSVPGTYAKSVDGRDLAPCRLWVEGAVKSLNIDRSIMGPIQTRLNGEIETLTITNSIVQAVGPDPAITMTTGVSGISRCTILGPANLHRLEASECILDDLVSVINIQDGCVRFSAYALGSVLPRKYESVEVAAQAPLFTSRDFGQPAYAQLLASVDAAIITGARDATISGGAEDGSEMGAFARDKNPIKERSILIKYQEYMPLGLVPVIIDAT
jgi:hypothetical protein